MPCSDSLARIAAIGIGVVSDRPVRRASAGAMGTAAVPLRRVRIMT
ncbi:hypothetical protein [uncultured Sphingomonas sp.]|nr:hypothetical protein [uncultured Sphingomonas sp.]